MDTDPQLELILGTIRRELRRMQIIFGISIIILALTLIFVAPIVIRMKVDDSYTVSTNSSLTPILSGTLHPVSDRGTSSASSSVIMTP